MWIFTRYGFYSATCARKDGGKGPMDPDTIQVRARMRQHLENLKAFQPSLLGGIEILELAGTDYRYRLIVPKEVWRLVAAALADDTDYANFKGVCGGATKALGSGYSSALGKVWSTMYGLQA